MTPPAVEDLQPIADKLSEASQKIYEAVQLAAQLGIKPRQLTNICSVIEHIEGTQLELLEAAKRPPSLRGDNHPPMYSPMTQFDIPSEHLEQMRRDFAEQMQRVNAVPARIGLGLGVGRKLNTLEREMVEQHQAMRDGDNP